MWKITKNKIDGLSGYKSPNYDTEKDKTLIHPFKLLDDDKNIYFIGVSNKVNFNALDDLGAAYGCTEIKFKENDIWTTL